MWSGGTTTAVPRIFRAPVLGRWRATGSNATIGTRPSTPPLPGGRPMSRMVNRRPCTPGNGPTWPSSTAGDGRHGRRWVAFRVPSSWSETAPVGPATASSPLPRRPWRGGDVRMRHRARHRCGPTRARGHDGRRRALPALRARGDRRVASCAQLRAHRPSFPRVDGGPGPFPRGRWATRTRLREDEPGEGMLNRVRRGRLRRPGHREPVSVVVAVPAYRLGHRPGHPRPWRRRHRAGPSFRQLWRPACAAPASSPSERLSQR